MRERVAALVFILAIVPMTLALSGCQKEQEQKQQAAAPPQSAPQQAAAPPQSAPQPAAGGKKEVNPEAMVHIRQGLAYASTAKNARSKTIFEENIDNAIKEFSLALDKAPNYADAYSNRAVAFMLQKKFNKAQEDLKKARELNPDSGTIHYNLASLYSLKGDLDLGLDEIDAALAKGFDDYGALRNDRDIDRLRKHPEFQKILEKHKVFLYK